VRILGSGSGRSTRVRKVVGSAAILGVAAAVAGLGTYSTFTDSTTPVATGVTSGVLSISLMDGASVATAPFQGGTFLAGDSVSKALDLVNDGDTPLASVTMRSWATRSSVLDTDQVNGLQLLVRDCPVAWTGSGAAASCAGAASTLYSGPVVTTRELANPASLAAGGVDHLMLTATLPSTAGGSAFQAVSSSFSFAFDGVQRAGADR
jgi:hypothetical protein